MHELCFNQPVNGPFSVFDWHCSSTVAPYVHTDSASRSNSAPLAASRVSRQFSCRASLRIRNCLELNFSNPTAHRTHRDLSLAHFSVPLGCRSIHHLFLSASFSQRLGGPNSAVGLSIGSARHSPILTDVRCVSHLPHQPMYVWIASHIESLRVIGFYIADCRACKVTKCCPDQYHQLRQSRSGRNRDGKDAEISTVLQTCSLSAQN